MRQEVVITASRGPVWLQAPYHQCHRVSACHYIRNFVICPPLPLGQMEPLLAVGTSEVLGEDSPCTGRVLLFEVRRPEGAGADSGEWQATRRYSR